MAFRCYQCIEVLLTQHAVGFGSEISRTIVCEDARDNKATEQRNKDSSVTVLHISPKGQGRYCLTIVARRSKIPTIPALSANKCS